MRALILVNPAATGMRRLRPGDLISLLSTVAAIEITETTRPGHAVELAAKAVVEDYDLVITIGGDGTVNETVHGLLGTPPSAAEAAMWSPPERTPALAILPAGNANVFARALGLPNQPRRAALMLRQWLAAGHRRRISLGVLHVTDPASSTRWFTFSAGFGLDADVVRRIAQLRAAGRRADSAQYVAQTIAALGPRHPGGRFLVHTRAAPDARVAGASATPGGAIHPEPAIAHRLLVITNTTPWTYLGPIPLAPTPDASFDTGLDVFGLRTPRIVPTITTALRLLTGRRPNSARTWRAHDLDLVSVTAEPAAPAHADGEYLGVVRSAELIAVPSALSVIAAPR
ncbi:MAG: hypothetical protein K6T37_06425 [Acidothermus cellulolyticus]|nr:hypothetical protein [Acidothermus cellulolyticus]